MYEQLLSRLLEKVISTKFLLTLGAMYAAMQAGQPELAVGAAVAYITGKTVQNGIAIKKNGVKAIPQEKPPKPSEPNSGASQPIPVIPTPAPDPIMPDYTLIDPMILKNYKAEEIGDVDNKNFLIYDALVKAGSGWNYYESAPHKVRVPDALRWMKVILPVAQARFKEVTGLDAPNSLGEIGGSKMYLMKIRNEVERVTGACVKNTDGWRMAIADLIDTFNHIESLEEMLAKGVRWDIVQPKDNNPWGLGDLGYAFVKEQVIAEDKP